MKASTKWIAYMYNYNLIISKYNFLFTAPEFGSLYLFPFLCMRGREQIVVIQIKVSISVPKSWIFQSFNALQTKTLSLSKQTN